MVDLNEMSECLQKGDAPSVTSLVLKALEENMDPEVILNEGLIAGMSVIGGKFKRNEAFVPEVLIAARAMNEGTKLLEGALLAKGVKPIGKAVIGTVKGDMHDIGKNLVSMMLKGAGFEVIDVGVNVSKEKYLEAATENNADVVLLSALLTTTMPYMKEIIAHFNESGVRDKFKIMLGGAPLTQDYCDQVGGDAYAADAASAAEAALQLLAAE